MATTMRRPAVRGRGAQLRRWAAGVGALGSAPLVLVACSSATGGSRGVVEAVAAERQYADVLSQVGGPYVHVSSVLDNPNTDPHTFELIPSVAAAVSSAQLVVQNGLGYDDFMRKIEAAAPSPKRKELVVQRVLGLSSATPDPHLWYDPGTMPRVASAMAGALSSIDPGHAPSFRANLAAFDASLSRWTSAVDAFRSAHAGTPVATTEPVADRLLQAMGTENRTPFRFQAAVMNGVDPSPQDISLLRGFFSAHAIKVLCYNEQVVDPLTRSLRSAAEAAGIPVVGFYEIEPAGYRYQQWMLAEVRALERALAIGASTEHL